MLDLFAGCGTTIEAAAKNGRDVIGIDILPFALRLINRYRLAPNGITQLPSQGVPVDMDTARQLARTAPFKFQDWTISLIDGLASNPQKVGDDGIDGFGVFFNTPDNMERKAILVQVTGAAGSQAECKILPLPILRARARAQLKSYMSATNTRYGVLAVGTDPRHWEFCENKYNNWFAEINRENFEWGIENWEPVSAAALTTDAQAKHRTSHWWKRTALFLGVLFVVSFASLLLLWPDPPEPIVYITRTGKKYHTYACEFLVERGVEKFAIYFDEAEKNYDPCGICNPHRTAKSR